jgi:hypothetical protein
MNETDHDITHHGPDKLLRGFTRSKILFSLLLAAGLHLVIIGVSSVGYIRDHWIDPEGAALRKQAAETAARQRLEAEAGRADQQPAAAPATAPAAPPSAATDEQLLEQRKDAPVVREITEASAPDEIPRQPEDLGISIQDITVK